jgi:hypothetical protein
MFPQNLVEGEQLVARRVCGSGLENMGHKGSEKLHEEQVKFHEVMESEVQLERQIQRDMWQRFMNSEESVLDGDKGGAHNIAEA